MNISSSSSVDSIESTSASFAASANDSQIFQVTIDDLLKFVGDVNNLSHEQGTHKIEEFSQSLINKNTRNLPVQLVTIPANYENSLCVVDSINENLGTQGALFRASVQVVSEGEYGVIVQAPRIKPAYEPFSSITVPIPDDCLAAFGLDERQVVAQPIFVHPCCQNFPALSSKKIVRTILEARRENDTWRRIDLLAKAMSGLNKHIISEIEKCCNDRGVDIHKTWDKQCGAIQWLAWSQGKYKSVWSDELEHLTDTHLFPKDIMCEDEETAFIRWLNAGSCRRTILTSCCFCDYTYINDVLDEGFIGLDDAIGHEIRGTFHRIEGYIPAEYEISKQAARLLHIENKEQKRTVGFLIDHLAKPSYEIISRILQANEVTNNIRSLSSITCDQFDAMLLLYCFTSLSLTGMRFGADLKNNMINFIVNLYRHSNSHVKDYLERFLCLIKDGDTTRLITDENDGVFIRFDTVQIIRHMVGKRKTK